MTNYNELGKEYVSYVSASGLQAYGTLRPEGNAILWAVRQEILQRQRNQWQPELTRDLQRLVSRLNTPFYYSMRVAHYLQEIERLPGGAGALGAHVPDEDFCPPLQVTRNHRELGMEFESLILHSVAILDTLANLLSDHCNGCKIYSQKTGKPIQIYFSNVREALNGALEKDKRSQYLLAVLNECTPTLENIVLSIGKKALRNHVAHETQIADLTESNFAIYWLEDGTVLRFDHEVYGMPLVASARNLIQTVSYLVVKSVAILLESSNSSVVQAELDAALAVTRNMFEPSWVNPVISWREFVSADASHQEFTVSRTEEDGFRIEHIRLNPEVFKYATPFDGKR